MTIERPINFNFLEKDFQDNKPTVLFLGSGLNYNCKTNLSWGALLDHLLLYAFDRIPQLQSNTVEIENIKKALQSNDSKKAKKRKDYITKEFADSLFPRDVKSTIVKQFLGEAFYGKLIRNFLYQKISRSTLHRIGKQYIKHQAPKGPPAPQPKSFFSLFVIADMILRHPNIKAVVTYNYDQFLEDALNILGKQMNKRRKYRIISDWECDNKIDCYNNDEISIYHVHGFIPRYDEIQSPQNSKVILSLDEYYEDTKNVYSWQVASQLHFLSQYTCLFCGLSMDDITTQRLLHYVKGKNRERLYYITAASNRSDSTRCLLEKIKNKYLEGNGLTVVYDENGFNCIYQLLGELDNERKQL